MIKVLKRLSDYTIEDFKSYCYLNALDYESYKYYYDHWAIAQHEADLNKFIKLYDDNTVITVTGSVKLDGHFYKVKPKTLTLSSAFVSMLTPDAQDYCIVVSLSSTYHVFIRHSRGYNSFKFKLSNDKN